MHKLRKQRRCRLYKIRRAVENRNYADEAAKFSVEWLGQTCRHNTVLEPYRSTHFTDVYFLQAKRTSARTFCSEVGVPDGSMLAKLAKGIYHKLTSSQTKYKRYLLTHFRLDGMCFRPENIGPFHIMMLARIFTLHNGTILSKHTCKILLFSLFPNMPLVNTSRVRFRRCGLDINQFWASSHHCVRTRL